MAPDADEVELRASFGTKSHPFASSMYTRSQNVSKPVHNTSAVDTHIQNHRHARGGARKRSGGCDCCVLLLVSGSGFAGDSSGIGVGCAANGARALVLGFAIASGRAFVRSMYFTCTLVVEFRTAAFLFVHGTSTLVVGVMVV